MTISTSGPDQNSYITISEANALLATMSASFLTAADTLVALDDDAYLIEAANDLEMLWDWCGIPTDLAQAMTWPRMYVAKPGWRTPREPGWTGLPYTYVDEIMYKVMYQSGNNAATQWVDSTVVPKAIKEAQALIAILRKQGGNLVGDTQGDAQGMQLGPVKVAYVNAIRESADIHKRCSQFGNFIGDAILRTPNA